jgi:Bacterial PH domain
VIVGVALGLFWGPRRLTLHIDEDGVEIGKLTSRRVLPWPEIAAFGIDEGPWGRSGRTLGLAVCHRGELQPVPVGTLTYTASAFRWHGTRPDERLEVHRTPALEPVRAWAEWAGVPVVEAAVDRWWDRQPDAHTDGGRAR